MIVLYVLHMIQILQQAIFKTFGSNIHLISSVQKQNGVYQQANTNYNHIIYNISDPNTYFILCMTDRWHIQGNNIDLELQKYIGIIPDHKFFLHLIERFNVPQSMMWGYRHNDNNVINTREMIKAIKGFQNGADFTMPPLECCTTLYTILEIVRNLGQ